MSIKNILVHLTQNARQDAETGLALALAGRHESRVTAIYVARTWQIPGYVLPYITEEMRAEQQRQAGEAAEAAKARFMAAADGAGIRAEWRQAEGDPRGIVALHARYADLLVMGQRDPDDESDDGFDLVGELVLTAGRPILAVPYVGSFADAGKRVMVAWSGTRESTRAVHDALPILEKAEKVIVYSVNPPDSDRIAAADICNHLAQHGVAAEAHHTVAPDLDVSDALLSGVADYGVDLLVMGAYGHSRVREFVLGGATREVLQHMTVPVLMSH